MINKFVDFMKNKLTLWLFIMWGFQWLLGKNHIVSDIFACIGLISALCWLKSEIDEVGIKETAITYIQAIITLIIIIYFVKYLREYLNISNALIAIIALILLYLSSVLLSLIRVNNRKRVAKALIIDMLKCIPPIVVVIIAIINIGFILSLLYLVIKQIFN